MTSFACKTLAGVALSAMLSAPVMAAEHAGLNLNLASSTPASWQVADADDGGATHSSTHMPVLAKEQSWLTSSKLHEYLGIGSLLLAGVTVLSAPDSEDGAPNSEDGQGLHQTAAWGALTLGAAAVATGFMYHFDDIEMKNGVTDVDNLHMALGLLGTLGYAGAIAQQPDSSHSGFGVLGGAAMMTAIYLEW